MKAMKEAQSAQVRRRVAGKDLSIAGSNGYWWGESLAKRRADCDPKLERSHEFIDSCPKPMDEETNARSLRRR
jgi:hypothetical protein